MTRTSWLAAALIGCSPTLPFQADADHVYRVAFTGAEAHVYEVDRAKDTLLRDVTLAPP